MTSIGYSHPARRSDLQRTAILLLAILQVLVTLLPSLGLGEQIGERSDAVRTAITPAGWAFSIWGLLYAGSLAYAIYQFLPAQRTNALLAKIGWASAGAFLGNALWALYTQFVDLNALSVVIITGTLLCLLACYRRFAALPRRLTRGEQFLVALPLSALAAWLTAATIVNIAASLKFHGVDPGETAPLAGAAVVATGGVIASAAIWNGRGNPWYALIFLWALAGIHARQTSANGIAVAAIAAALLVVAGTLVRLGYAADRERWFGAGG
jgi:hypothetical protein